MSRDFQFRCITCDPVDPANKWGNHIGRWGDGCDFNWKGDELLKLLPHFSLFVTVARAGFAIDFHSLGLFGSCSPGTIAQYALAHEGHDVRVWDEYGAEWPQRRCCKVVKRIPKFGEALEGYAKSDLPSIYDVLECGCEVLAEHGAPTAERNCPNCVEPDKG